MNDLPDYLETLEFCRRELPIGAHHAERLAEIAELLTYIGEQQVLLPGLLNLARRRKQQQHERAA